jgi:hypothetical protein
VFTTLGPEQLLADHDPVAASSRYTALAQYHQELAVGASWARMARPLSRRGAVERLVTAVDVWAAQPRPNPRRERLTLLLSEAVTALAVSVIAMCCVAVQSSDWGRMIVCIAAAGVVWLFGVTVRQRQ